MDSLIEQPGKSCGEQCNIIIDPDLWHCRLGPAGKTKVDPEQWKSFSPSFDNIQINTKIFGDNLFCVITRFCGKSIKIQKVSKTNDKSTS